MSDLLTTHGLRLLYPVKRRSALAPRAFLHAVDGVDLRVRAGEAIGLVGESGCGKSSLARLICQLVGPTSGEVRLDGAPLPSAVARFAKDPRRREIQMVFQDPTESLAPHLTVQQLIADPVRRLLAPISPTAADRIVRDAAAAVMLPDRLLGHHPHQLSGGEKARVGIARAIAVNPRLLVLDEPTSSLDVSVQATILKLLDRLRRDRGIALVYVSHDLSVVRLLCQRIAVMYLGQIVEEGTSAEIFGAPRHPYTQALLSAAPTLPPRRAVRQRLEGEPVSPINPAPHACRLIGRCPIEAPLCRTQAPNLHEAAPGHLSRCHFD